MSEDNIHDSELNTDNEVKTGEFSEAELEVAKKIARRSGWRDKDEFLGSEDTWTDPVTFLTYTPEQRKKAREQVEAEKRLSKQMREEQRLLLEQEFDKRLREAVFQGNADEAVRLRQQYAQQIDPNQDLIRDYIAERPWFNTDVAAQAIAAKATHENRHLPVSEQLRLADEAVAARFPEYFGGSQAPVTTHQTRAPMVQAPSRQSSSKPKELNWKALDPAVKQGLLPSVESAARKYKKDVNVVKEEFARQFYEYNGITNEED